jgi:hypothetical protein
MRVEKPKYRQLPKGFPGLTGGLFAHANPVDPQPQITTVVRTTFNIELAGFSGSAIGVKWIAVRLLVVLIARKLAAGAHTIDPPAWLDAFAARRAVGVECACHGLRARKRQCQCHEPIFRAGYLHGVTGMVGKIVFCCLRMPVPSSRARAI